MTQNGQLPTFLLFPDSAGIWHVSDRHGNLLMTGNRHLRGRALLSLLQEAGVSYQIINPLPHQRTQKGKTQC